MIGKRNASAFEDRLELLNKHGVPREFREASIEVNDTLSTAVTILEQNCGDRGFTAADVVAVGRLIFEREFCALAAMAGANPPEPLDESGS